MSTPSLNIQAITTYRAARFNPLADFGPDKLTTAIREFRAGRLRDLSMIMDSIEETDDVLMSVVPKAKAAVARRGWEILTVDTKNPADAALAEQQKETLTYFYNNLRATSAWDQDELGGVSLLLRQMMDAKGKRYSVHNIVWRPDGQGHYTATFWHTPLCFFENTTGRMRYIAQPYGYEGDDMEPGSWLVTKGTGVMIACSVAWMFKHLPLQDWLIYCERHGMPGIEGVTDAQRDSPQWIAMVDAVTQAARDFSWVRNRSDEIKTIDFGGTGTLPYPQLIERMDRALSALWRGADLSTISAGSGSGQGASLQAMEAELIEQDDATWLSETLSMKVDRLVLDNVYGTDTPALAYVKIIAGSDDDVDRDLKVDAFAAQVGHPISQAQFAERYNRPVPAAGEVLLQAPASPASAPGQLSAVPKTAALPAINERQSMGREQIFRATAMNRLEAAQQQSMAPLLARIDRLEAAKTPIDYERELRALKADLPAMYYTIAGDAALSSVFEEIMGAAVVSGVASAKTA